MNTSLSTSNSLADLAHCVRGVPGRIKWEPPPGTKTNPYLDCFPMMTHYEFSHLVLSIKRHGLIEPISCDQGGVIIDGRQRLMACVAAGVEPRFETVEIKDDDPRDFIIRKNVLRKHRSRSERLVADALVEGLLPPDPEYSALVLPEARVVAKYKGLAQDVMNNARDLANAYEIALEHEREREHDRQEAERREHLREKEPFLAHQVDEGKLTLDQAIVKAEEKAAMPVLAEHAAAIRTIGKRVVADLIEIGRRLTQCKAMLGHGNWLPWLEREFGWSDSSAARYMQAYQLSVKFPNLGDLELPISGIYQLAQPSTPSGVREEILARAEHERISHGEVKRLIDAARGKTSSPGNRLQGDLRDLADRMAEERPDDPLVAELRRLVSGEAAG